MNAEAQPIIPNPTVGCMICESAEYAPWDVENGYDFVKCGDCGLLYVRNPPPPEEIEKGHQQGEHRGEEVLDVTRSYCNHSEKQHRQRLAEIFAGNPPTGTWLDIGCGHGEFITALTRLYGDRLEVMGSEPNVKKRAGATERGLNVSYFDLETHDRQYDYLSLMNVFSHLRFPVEFFNTMNRLTKPGGKIIVQTGDTADLDAKDHYKPYALPDHLHFASAGIMRDFLRRTGFEVEHIYRYPYRERTPWILFKEFVKLFHPTKKSMIPQLSAIRGWDGTNMYILARKVAEPSG